MRGTVWEILVLLINVSCSCIMWMKLHWGVHQGGEGVNVKNYNNIIGSSYCFASLISDAYFAIHVGWPTCHLIPFAYFYQQMHPELLWIYSTIKHLFTFVLWKHLYYSFSLKGKNWFWNSIDYVKLYENDNDFHVSKSNFFLMRSFKKV